MRVFSAVMALQLMVIGECSQIDTGPYRHSLLHYHNDYRKRLNGNAMRELVWDDGLASAAEYWSQQCTYQIFDNNIGQNIYYTTIQNPDKKFIKEALDLWNRTSFSNVVASGKCHGTCDSAQLLWENTLSVGCAIEQCSNLKVRETTVADPLVLVCFYWPRVPRNVEVLYKKGLSCSACPYGTQCRYHLCYDTKLAKRLRAPPHFYRRHLRNILKIKERRPRRQFSGKMTATEEYYIVDSHNAIRRTRGVRDGNDLTWSAYLAKWANYIIRCNIEYPGPRTTYTNFANENSGFPVYNIVYKWSREGNNENMKLDSGCRTPYDRTPCNHYTIIIKENLREMGCATRLCPSHTQLVCLYK